MVGKPLGMSNTLQSRDILKMPWKDVEYTVVDLETTGAAPIEAEICEIGAVKWRQGKIVDHWQTLIKPTVKMTDFIVGIHGITNQMVAQAPTIQEKLPEFRDFVGDSVVVAHHAPFDAGFLAHEFEKQKLPMPVDPLICTSLLARSVIPESTNHKLQTLVQFLKLEPRKAHRALADAEACLDVFLACCERLNPAAKLDDIVIAQKKHMVWDDYGMFQLTQRPELKGLFEGLREKAVIGLEYSGGTFGGKLRKVRPLGVIRNPDGDYLKAFCLIDNREKRFYLTKISQSVLID